MSPERGEKNAIYSGHLRLCQQPRAAHTLHSDQLSYILSSPKPLCISSRSFPYFHADTFCYRFIYHFPTQKLYFSIKSGMSLCHMFLKCFEHSQMCFRLPNLEAPQICKAINFCESLIFGGHKFWGVEHFWRVKHFGVHTFLGITIFVGVIHFWG